MGTSMVQCFVIFKVTKRTFDEHNLKIIIFLHQQSNSYVNPLISNVDQTKQVNEISVNNMQATRVAISLSLFFITAVIFLRISVRIYL